MLKEGLSQKVPMTGVLKSNGSEMALRRKEGEVMTSTVLAPLQVKSASSEKGCVRALKTESRV